jgi:predicted alpha-1,6-mannanase (GH76 family)
MPSISRALEAIRRPQTREDHNVLTAGRHGAAMLHNLKHNKVLTTQSVTVRNREVPWIASTSESTLNRWPQLLAGRAYGFKNCDVRASRSAPQLQSKMKTSYLSATVIPSIGGMTPWRGVSRCTTTPARRPISSATMRWWAGLEIEI